MTNCSPKRRGPALCNSGLASASGSLASLVGLASDRAKPLASLCCLAALLDKRRHCHTEMPLNQTVPSVGDYSMPIIGMPSRHYITEDTFDRKDCGLAVAICLNSLATAEKVREEGRLERERDRKRKRRKRRTTRREE